MTYLEAAEVILREAGRPMTAAEVTTQAVQRCFIKPVGKTPTATMTATLYVKVAAQPDGHIRKLAAPGPTPARRGSVRWVWRTD